MEQNAKLPFIYEPDRFRKTPVDESKCRASCNDRFGFWQCQRNATLYEHGYGWCGQHAPSRAATRRKKKLAEHRQRGAVRNARSERERLAYEIAAEAVALSKQEGDYDRLMELAAKYAQA